MRILKMLNASLTKIYGRIEQTFNNVNINAFIKEYIEKNENEL